VSELRLLQFRDAFARQLASLAPGTEARRLLSVGLRQLAEFFAADSARLVVQDLATQRHDELRTAVDGTAAAAWPRGVTLAGCLAWIERDRTRARLPAGPLLGRVVLDSRRQGIVVLARGNAYPRRLREPFRRCLELLQAELDRRQQRRLGELKDRLSEKLVRKLPPKDFFYQLFHGLRSLLHYDHSASLLVARSMGGSLELVAEQLAWKKGKSGAVGVTVALPAELREHLLSIGGASLLAAAAGPLAAAAAAAEAPLRCGLQHPAGGELPPPVRSCIVAPLRHGDALLGVLRIAGREPASLGADHAARLDSFLPIAAAALANQLHDQQANDRMLALDRQRGMAELARGVAHDVNNALGALLPLLEQCRSDLASGISTRDVLCDDLAAAERYGRYCKKIFGGMLRFARRGQAQPAVVDVNAAVQEAMDLVGEDLRGRGIELRAELAAQLPPASLAPGAIDQIVVNLLHNARDATPRGGSITVATRSRGDGVELQVRDTGSGIAAADLAQLPQPFFTTKPGGNGLGLALVRSLAWDHDGELVLQSELGRGTTVTVELKHQRRPL
jgi:signal transduction histidine kinase